MNQEFDKKKLERMLQRMVDVLRINVFIVDENGRAMIMPRLEGYGWKLWANTPIGSDIMSGEKSGWIKKFKKQGKYLEHKDAFELHSFVFPVEVDHRVVGYMVVGPILLNQRFPNIEYRKIALKLGLNLDDLTDIISEIRVISFLDLKSILDLLMEVFSYAFQLSHDRSKQFERAPESGLASALLEPVSSEYVVGLLEAFLDTALSLTRAECGSVMIQDPENGDLKIRVSRGLADEQVKVARLKVGEGIAGLAFQEDSPFLIHERSHSDNRIRHLLKRSEIKHAMVLPLRSRNKVFGVLNIHTKKLDNHMEEDNLLMVQNLSRLASAALESFEQKAA